MTRARTAFDHAHLALTRLLERYGTLDQNGSHAAQVAWLELADLWDDAADASSGEDRESARRLARRIRTRVSNLVLETQRGGYDVRHAGTGRRGYETVIEGLRVTIHAGRAGFTATVHFPSGRTLPGGSGPTATEAERTTRALLRRAMPRS